MDGVWVGGWAGGAGNGSWVGACSSGPRHSALLPLASTLKPASSPQQPPHPLTHSYVSTLYGTRSLEAVKKDIETW